MLQTINKTKFGTLIHITNFPKNFNSVESMNSKQISKTFFCVGIKKYRWSPSLWLALGVKCVEGYNHLLSGPQILLYQLKGVLTQKVKRTVALKLSCSHH